MADILSQDEVDLLLSAVSKGEVAVDTGQEAEQDRSRPSAYDFRRPERVSKEQLKGLQSLFEAFAREMSIAMPPFLRSVVRIDLVSIDQLTYDEFILSISRPTSLAIINMAPLEGSGILEMSPSMVFPIVDRLLGGKGLTAPQVRELTEIENRILHRLILTILDCWKRSWEQLVEFKMSVVQQESDPLIVQIVAGSEMIILVGYELHIGDVSGSVNICIPLMVLNPILDQISQQAHYRRRMSPAMAARTRDLIGRTLHRVKLPVTAILGEAVLPLDDIARLQVGDIIQLDADSKDPVAVEVGSLVRFRAQSGRRGEQRAVQITDLVRD